MHLTHTRADGMSSKSEARNTASCSRPSDTFCVPGARVDASQIPDVTAQMQDWVARPDSCRYIAVTGMHGVTEARHDPQLRAALASASLVVPDGMPLVWLGRRHGFHLPRRVYGPELMLRFWQETTSTRCRHFLYGGAPGVADALARKFASQFPTHQIAGTFSPPYRNLSPEEDREICSIINGSHPDRSEEHTSELQSLTNLVWRLLLEIYDAFNQIRLGAMPLPSYRAAHPDF